MKKKLSLLLALLLCLGLVPQANADSSPFGDVPASHWAYTAIMEAYEDGAVAGTGTNSGGQPLYSPDSKVIMSQFIAILTRAFYADEVAASTRDTTDVWYNKNYGVAYDHDLFNSVENWFGNDEVTREAMAQVMYNVMLDKGIVLPNEQELQIAKNRIPDFQSVSTENGDAVAACYYLELISGMDQVGSFAPKGVMNRAQTAVIYTRLKTVMNLLGGVEVQKPGTVPGTTTTPGTNPGTVTTPAETSAQASGATLTNGMPATEENVLTLIEEYRNGKTPGAKAQAAGFTSYVNISYYDAYEPKYGIRFPDGVMHNGTECAKFAFAFFDDIFGDLPMRTVEDHRNVRPGDLLHFDGHWSIAIGRGSYDYDHKNLRAYTVDGGSTGEIDWGTVPVGLEGQGLLEVYTRYPTDADFGYGEEDLGAGTGNVFFYSQSSEPSPAIWTGRGDRTYAAQVNSWSEAQQVFKTAMDGYPVTVTLFSYNDFFANRSYKDIEALVETYETSHGLSSAMTGTNYEIFYFTPASAGDRYYSSSGEHYELRINLKYGAGGIVRMYREGVINQLPTTRYIHGEDASYTPLLQTAETIERQYGLTSSSSDYDKVSAIYQWMTANIANESSRGDLTGYAYPAVINYTLATHRGYSFYTVQTFQALCTIFDLDCYLVKGESTRGGSYYWNLVNVGGQWYHADVSQDAGTSAGAYRYFLVSDSTILKERTINKDQYSYPASPSDYR